MRIGIAGIHGRVGRLLAARAAAAADLELVGGTARGDDLASLAARCDVLVDFTAAAAAAPHAAILADTGTAWVLGTTGLDDAAQAAIHDAAGRIAIVQAANFSPGVVLMRALAARIAAALPAESYDAEILETHHRHKTDAPSGTALELGRTVAAARGTPLVHADRSAPRRAGEIGFAVQRAGAIVGEHAIGFTSDAEQLTLSHRAFDRGVFAAGALRAARWLRGRKPGLYGMEDVLGMR